VRIEQSKESNVPPRKTFSNIFTDVGLARFMTRPPVKPDRSDPTGSAEVGTKPAIERLLNFLVPD